MTGLSRRAGREGPLEMSGYPEPRDECSDDRDPLRVGGQPCRADVRFR